MKLLLESWKSYVNEAESPFLSNINPTDKVFVTSKEYKGFVDVKQQAGPWMKPNGLWYACGDEWIRFDHGLQNAKYLYKIELDYSKILRLTQKDVKAFEKEYGVNKGNPSMKMVVIDWKKVSERYGGIEICPYMPKIREHFWYYGWDVASGCIWDKDSIKDVSLVMSLD